MSEYTVPLVAMQELWDRANDYLKEYGHKEEVVLKNPITSKPETVVVRTAVTPGGLSIERVGNFLSVSAEFVKWSGGVATETTTAVEYSDDLRELPTVSEHWETLDGDDIREGVFTVSQAGFRLVAKELTGLIEPPWAEEILPTAVHFN